MESTTIDMVCLDQTLIDVYDKKYKKYLIPRKNILKAKYYLEDNPSDKSTSIQINDKDGKCIDFLIKSILDLNEDNITYQWLEVLNKDNKPIIVKKEQLLQMKISNEELNIMDYFTKKHYVIPSRICRCARKYKATDGKGIENILFKLKDENNVIHFVTKPIVKFAKKKRMLNDESFVLEITNKEKMQINVPIELIRDLDDFNPYNEWCEVKEKDGTKIIVKKTDLQDLKEQCDKNITIEEYQRIMDHEHQVYDIKPCQEYAELFPDKYSYLPKGKWEEYSTVDNTEGTQANIKTSLIEYYLNDNIKDLGYYEEVNDDNQQKIIINPYDIVKKIISNYKISSQKGTFVELITQSGTKHLIKVSLIAKVKAMTKKKEDYVSIKGSNDEKIIATFQKINELTIDDDKLLLIPLEDNNQIMTYVSIENIKGIVNRIISGEPFDEYESVIDYLNEAKLINVKQIQMKNTVLKKNFDI